MTLFGIVVTMWGVVRAVWPVPLLIAADTAGRAAFTLTFIWALVAGHSTVIVGFLVLELTFLLAQALGVRKALKADRVAPILSSQRDADPGVGAPVGPTVLDIAP